MDTYKKCTICGTRGGRVDGIKRIFMTRFPINEYRCKQWVKAIGNQDLVYIPIEKLHENKYVCRSHFRKNDFNKNKNRLKKSAIPSLDINLPPLDDEIMAEFPCHIFVSSLPMETVEQVCELSTSANVSEDMKCIKTNYVEPSTSTQAYNIMTQDEQRKKVSWSEPSTSTQANMSQNIQKRKICYDLRKKIGELSPRKKKLIQKLRNNKITIKYLQNRVKMIDNIQSPALKSLILSSMYNQSRLPQAKRWSNYDKGLALSIYKKSPKTYRFIKDLVPMPSVRTLQTVLQHVTMEPGINENIIMHLKKRGQGMTFNNKTCALLFDEIALKKRLIYNVMSDKIDGYEDLGEEGGRTERIADHALVFMLQGVHKKFKQPVAYYFVKGTISSQKLAVIIKSVIRAVFEAGYVILTTVCDQGPTNIGALNLLKRFSNNSPSSHFFLLDDYKVFTIYDVPHLFKSIRNNFLQGGELIFNNKKAQWVHLIELENKNNSTLHFQKITKVHVNPKFRAKMKVKLAAQILSNTVAGILKLLSENVRDDEERSREIMDTAHIIEQLDLLFDCTNGPSSHKNFKKGIRENVSKNSNHHKLWPEFKKTLSTMQFYKSDSQLRLKNVRCIQGYIITISSFQDIWKYVESKGFKYLNLRQLNQDSLENMFGMIRQHSPTSRNPTCHHFVSALKSIIITRLSTPISRGANCEKDKNNILFDFNDIVFQKSKEAEQTKEDNFNENSENLPVLHITEDHDKNMEMEENLLASFENQPIVYVSGYIASVISKKIDCVNCHNCIKVTDPTDDNNLYKYIELREWWKDKKSLTYPTIELCNTIKSATEIFEKEVRPTLFNRSLSQYSITMMLSVCDLSWLCGEHSSHLSQQIFIRLSQLLIRNECRILNRSFALSEEESADSAKRAQAQGVAK